MKNIDSAQQKDNKPAPGLIISSKPVQIQSVNLIKQPGGGKRWLKRILVILVLAILILGGSIVYKASNLYDKIFVGTKTSFFDKLRQVMSFGQAQPFVGQDLRQVNILLLGIGGEGHDGPYLTDTMMVAQIRPETGEVALTSIPRDYWTQMPDSQSFAKINEAFSDGYLKHHDWNEGGAAARSVTETLTGLTLPYFAVIDFSGFEKAVNIIGGIDVNVERTFTDYTFPNDATNGYLPPQTFTQGPAHFDGKTALIFARSRHAEGPEGSDFARSARQQKVIAAFKDKLFKLNLFTDSGKINTLLDTLAEHFHTNLSPNELYRIYSLAQQRNIHNFISTSLDPDTYIICPQILPDTGAYVLEVCPGKTDSDIQNFFKNAFSIGKLLQEKAVIWMGNSNPDTAAYRLADSKLKESGLQVWEVPYPTTKPLSQNVFYQVNPMPATAEFIKNTLGAQEMTLPPPGIKIDKSKVDVIIILGKDN